MTYLHHKYHPPSIFNLPFNIISTLNIGHEPQQPQPCRASTWDVTSPQTSKAQYPATLSTKNIPSDPALQNPAPSPSASSSHTPSGAAPVRNPQSSAKACASMPRSVAWGVTSQRRYGVSSSSTSSAAARLKFARIRRIRRMWSSRAVRRGIQARMCSVRAMRL